MSEMRQAKRLAFDHLLTEVLEFSAVDEITRSMADLGYDSIDDLTTMTEDEIMSLTYSESNSERKVPAKQKRSYTQCGGVISRPLKGRMVQ